MQPGQVFADRFQVEEKIGEGGVGRVYRVLDLRTQGRCALKCLHPRYTGDAKVRRRFLREARAVARLTHPNIVRLFTYGEDDEGVPFIVMELIEGEPLSALRDRDLGLEVLLGLMDQCLAALAFSHSRGIIHRDFKPENVLVVASPEGLSAKLLDFGFARVEEDQDPKLTQAQKDAFGTPQYMAPEQASGKGRIGPPTDLYAVGVVLYEFLAGRPPFTGAHGMAVALKHLMEPVPPLVPRAGLRVPPGLIKVVLRALEKEARDRFATAGDMRRALGQFWGEDLASQAGEMLSASAVERAGDASLGWATARHDTVVGVGAAGLQPAAGSVDEEDAGRVQLGHTPIVGREQDLLWLWARARAVCEAGEGRVVLLGAAPGMGKSRVLGWLRDQIAEGGWMLCIGGVHGPDQVRLSLGLRGALDDLFGELPAEREGAERALREIVQRWGAAADETAPSGDAMAVSALVSYLRPGLPAASSVAVGLDLRGDVLFERICEALRLAARERPILLTLEAIERAGSDTCAFLLHLAAELRDRPFPLLAIVTYTTDDAGGPQGEAAGLVQALAGVESEGVERRILEPLAAERVVELLRSLAPVGDGVAEAIARRTRGNPFFAAEMLLYLRQSGELRMRGGSLCLSRAARPADWPGDLLSTLSARASGSVERAPDSAFLREVLLRSTVLGESFDYGLVVDYLARVVGETDRIERAVESLLQLGLFLESRDPQMDRLMYAHGTLWRALRADLAAGELRVGELERRAAEAMETWHAGELDAVAGEIAAHFAAAGAVEQAAEYYVRAATAARMAGQSARIFELLEAGDALLSRQRGAAAQRRRASLWLELGEMEVRRGGFDRAGTLADRVYQWAREREEPRLVGRALLLLGDLQRRQGGLEDAARRYEQATAWFGRAADEHGRARALLGTALVERGLGRLGEARLRFSEARVAMDQVGDRLGAGRARQGLGELALRCGDPAGARGALLEARTNFADVGDRAGAIHCGWLAGQAAAQLGQTDEAHEAYEQALRSYAALGNRAGVARCHVSLARLYADRGAWREGAGHYQSAVISFGAVGDLGREAAAQEELGLWALVQRQFDLARRCLEGALGYVQGVEDSAKEVVLRASLAWAAGEMGDTVAFEAELQTVLVLDRMGTVIDDDLARAFGGIAEVDAYLGESERAVRLLGRAIEIHRSLGGEADAAQLEERRAALMAAR